MQRAEEKSKFLRTRLLEIPYDVLRGKKLEFSPRTRIHRD